MDKKSNYKLILLIITLLTITTLINVLFVSKKDKTGYILLNDVFEKFEMSKEYSSKIESIENKRMAILDSLKLEVVKAEKISPKDLEYSQQLYFYKKQEFEKSNEQVRTQLNEQIWTQLNQYVNDYGKENGYSYIYGANGDGSIMYVNEKLNLTSELITFVNRKYKGKK